MREGGREAGFHGFAVENRVSLRVHAPKWGRLGPKSTSCIGNLGPKYTIMRCTLNPKP